MEQGSADVCQWGRAQEGITIVTSRPEHWLTREGAEGRAYNALSSTVRQDMHRVSICIYDLLSNHKGTASPIHIHSLRTSELPSTWIVTAPLSEINRAELITYMIESEVQLYKTQEQYNIIQEQLNMDFQNEINCLQEMLNLRNSNQDPPIDLYDLKGSDEGNNKIDLLTKEPSDTL
ncbi:hypothetical protein Tco_1088108 [Tanacetum coccineum]